LDPIDAEAVAAGAEPLLAPDAAAHARECPSCQGLIASARSLSEALEGAYQPSEAAPGLAERVTRLRAFSRRERRTYALWNAPVLLTAGLGVSGLALLALPGLTASEQVTVGAAALAPILAILRSTAAWASDLAALAPRGLQALSEGMRGESSLGIVSLLLLPPLSFGLRRVLARTRRS